MTTKNEGRAARVSRWLDERIGHVKLLEGLLAYGVAGGARWSYALGSALTIVFVVQLVTGLLLMTVYAPGAASAWASVHYVTHRLAAGWVIRGLHHFSSQAMVVLVAAHLLRTAVAGAYKRPREVTWWLGIALLGLTLALSHTGFMLPWDQKGYWGARMAMGIAGTTPVIGRWLQELLQGGPDFGSLTVTRLYALHAGVLPLLFLLVLFAHVALFRRHGVTTPARVDRSKVEPYFPRQAGKDLAIGLLVYAVLFAVVLRFHGAPLDPPADPLADYPARPEWYLVPIFELRKWMHGPLELVATMLVPGLVFGYLLALPLLDRTKTTDVRRRLGVLWPIFAGMVGFALLLFISLRGDANDPEYQRARAKADALAATASKLAMNGVPPAGPLEMLAHDPELRGESLFAKNCSSCHVLDGLGNRKKATASVLDGWGTEAWVASMMDNPDADDRFGRTPFKGMMPSMLHPPVDRKPDDPPFKPMTDGDVKAVAVFLASQSDGASALRAARSTPDDDTKSKASRDPAQRKAGEAIVSVRCTTCHLWKGEGDDSTQGYAPELSGWGTAVWARAQLTDPATNATYRESALEAKLKGHMPRFDGDLAPADLELLAEWVVAHARGRSLR